MEPWDPEPMDWCLYLLRDGGQLEYSLCVSAEEGHVRTQQTRKRFLISDFRPQDCEKTNVSCLSQ